MPEATRLQQLEVITCQLRYDKCPPAVRRVLSSVQEHGPSTRSSQTQYKMGDATTGSLEDVAHQVCRSSVEPLSGQIASASQGTIMDENIESSRLIVTMRDSFR